MTQDEHTQEIVDNLGITIWQDREGLLHHLKPGDIPPPGVKLWKPKRLWQAPIHGTDPVPEAPPPPPPPPRATP